MHERLDALDRQLLDVIQSGFPLVSRPYAKVGAELGLTESETLARVRRLKQLGVIRRLGASFNSRGLGWTSTLCAARVPEDRLDGFVAEVNRHPGVTHNYLRKNEFNVWFTLIAESTERIEAILQAIQDATGVEVLNLPAEKLFKIKVDFNMAGK
jgi:DNA-binding Lrp family transcriptional regulator